MCEFEEFVSNLKSLLIIIQTTSDGKKYRKKQLNRNEKGYRMNRKLMKIFWILERIGKLNN